MLKNLFGTKAAKIPLSHLPHLHSFVDVSVCGKPAVSVSVESNGPKQIVTANPGASAGTAVFTYSNAAGKFRFGTRIIGVRGNTVLYEMPLRIENLSGGLQNRTSVRMDAIVPGTWRMVRKGVAFGDSRKANLRDISRGGCSLILDFEVPGGSYVEVQLNFKNGGAQVLALGEVVRVERIKSSGKWSHGLRFQGVTADQDRVITEFINRRQSDLRSRGLA
ncbi:MAG: PilZ domain-containing protein [Candidatus Eremiobacteraeota bacterium]|nr:PilZ domain-containing protein [Candidatus Eremiobacteraeota bacterium]